MDPTAAGLAETALTGPLHTAARIDEAAALSSPAVVLSARLDRYYGRLRRPSGRSSISRGHRLSDATLRQHMSAGCRAGEGLPSSRRHYLNVPRPIRRGVPRGCDPGATPLPWPSPRSRRARLSLVPPFRAAE